MHGIIWMNEPVHSEFASASIAYGNQASLAYQFSYAAILVVVPPSAVRLAGSDNSNVGVVAGMKEHPVEL